MKMKRITYTTRNGLNYPLSALTTDVKWFKEEIEKTPRELYMEIFKSPKVSRRIFKKVYQDEIYTFFIIIDCYKKKTFLEIKEDRYDV